MSGFDKQWLALREPEDRKARSKTLIDRFMSIFKDTTQPATIVDIGSGTGSTYRALSPYLPKETCWRLVDYDERLLEEARRHIDVSANVEFHQQDLNHFDDALLEGAGVVTASALFDLCSAEFCDAFVEKLARKKVGLYAALNYDGVMKWTVSHPLDRRVVEDFNMHQTSNKGFGPALGPQATGYLLKVCGNAGFDCRVDDSPWRMDHHSEALQIAFLNGLSAPLMEMGRLKNYEIAEWLDFRLSHVGVDGSLCIVGHKDFFALPRG